MASFRSSNSGARIVESRSTPSVSCVRSLEPIEKPSKISGGEGQRVAIARAMVKRPSIVLADEPTANLDAKNAHAIIQTMKKLNKELNTTFLFSTHDEKVMSYLDRMVHLDDGKVAEDEIIEIKSTQQ